ncbi:MAG: hypothetical protein L6408_03585 [Nanoarchaeota archaeon]|nr:hypothetical protein [Nanoarchaeota archaeon]
MPKISLEGFVKNETKNDKAALYTAVKTYERKDKALEIKLAGEIHFGEKQYFKDLVDELAPLDKILYEMIVPSKLSWGEKLSLSYLFYKSVHKYYQSIKENLDVTFRGEVFNEVIENDAQNGKKWEHCDISLKEFINYDKDSNEKALYALTILTGPLARKMNKKMPEKVKQYMILNIEEGLKKAKFGKTIIDIRNAKVKSRLDELYKTSSNYRIGIIYGAGHMPDFEDHITNSLGFKKKEEKWLKAFESKL